MVDLLFSEYALIFGIWDSDLELELSKSNPPMNRQRQRQRQTGSDGLTLLLLLGQLWQQVDSLPVKPLVTLTLMGVMVTAHVEPLAVPFLNFQNQDICLNPAAVVFSLGSGQLATSVLRVAGSTLVR